MAAFFPGAGPPHLLTPTQRWGYLQHLGPVLWLRDRVMLQYHFSKIGDEGVEAMLTPTAETAEQIKRGRAFKRFIRHYGLNPDEEITQEAAREFLAALKGKRVPRWVLGAVDLPDIKEAAGEVMKQ